MLKKIFQKQFLIELFLLSVLVTTLHYVALVFTLYWIISWFDVVMHFLGGFNMGLLAVFIFFTSGYIRETYDLRHNKMVLFLITMMFTLIIGLAWELWEVFFGLSSILLDRLDTVVDLIMDMIGSLFAFWYVRNKIQ